MKTLLRRILLLIKSIRFIPMYLVFSLSKKHQFFLQEKNIWINVICNSNNYGFWNTLFIWNLPEYRSVFYMRIRGYLGAILSLFAKPQLCLTIERCKIECGLVIQHGHSTQINPKSVGQSCQVWHNVTIGTNISHSRNLPTIKNNVKICAGAIVIGNITIGNNVTIAAGAVVTKNVPDNCIVAGNPAKIIKQNGNKVNIPL